MMNSLKALAIAAIVCGGYIAHAQQVIHFSQPMPDFDSAQVSVDGHAGTFLFDSGFGISAVTPDMAKTIGCTPWGKLTGFRATGERGDSQRCNEAVLTVNGLHLHVPQLMVFDLPKFLGKAGQNVSGALALDAFDGKVVTLSVADNTLTVETLKSAAQIMSNAQEIPIRLVRDVDGAALGADLGIRTTLGMTWMEIDTGNGGPCLIDKSVAPLFRLDSEKQDKQSFDATVGTAHFRCNAVVKDMIRDGNLGREALKQWSITLDLAHSRGWIRPIA